MHLVLIMVEDSFFEYLSRTGKIRAIIGNGFDLFCGLHTTYSDYYCKFWKKYLSIQKAMDNYVYDNKEIDFSNEIIGSCNIWDVFFAMHSFKSPEKCMEKWCDIEKLILESLLSESEAINRNRTLLEPSNIYLYPNDEKRHFSKKDQHVSLKIRWPELKKIFPDKTKARSFFEKIMIIFIQNRMKQKGISSLNYYEFLLDELGDFEKTFGDFVNEQTINNNIYKSKVYSLLQLLCPVDYHETDETWNKLHIDSFNYTRFASEPSGRDITLNHINGSYENPIFGVDSCFEPSDHRFVFTKTSRRMESKMIYSNYTSDAPFENIVVFGHSLYEADYSYFFPILDKMKMLDSDAKGVIVFAYHIYDKRRTRTIKSELRKNVAQMLYIYAKDNKVPNPKRFIDSISTQKRILFYEVSDDIIKRHEAFDNPFEDEWKRMLKNMKEELKRENFSINRDNWRFE